MRVVFSILIWCMFLSINISASQSNKKMPLIKGPVRIVPIVAAIDTVVKPYFYFSDTSIYTLDAKTWECKSIPWLALSPEKSSCERPVAKGSLVDHDATRETGTPSPTTFEVLQESNKNLAQADQTVLAIPQLMPLPRRGKENTRSSGDDKKDVQKSIVGVNKISSIPYTSLPPKKISKDARTVLLKQSSAKMSLQQDAQAARDMPDLFLTPSRWMELKPLDPKERSLVDEVNKNQEKQ